MIVTAIHNTRNVLPEIIRDDAYGYSPNGGVERIVRGDDGSVYYTPDHYDTFVRIE